MTTNEEIPVDEDGLPILTDIIPDDRTVPGNARQPDGQPAISTAEIAKQLLGNEIFRQKFDEIAAHLTVTVRQQVENTVKPAIEEAINQAMNISGDNIYTTINKQLEQALPDILASALREENTNNH